MRRHTLVDVCLVDNLWDQLRTVGESTRVGCRKFAAQDGIFATSCDQQAEQCPNTVHCEAEDDDSDENEYGNTSAHIDGCCSSRPPFPRCSQAYPEVVSRVQRIEMLMQEALGLKHS